MASLSSMTRLFRAKAFDRVLPLLDHPVIDAQAGGQSSESSGAIRRAAIRAVVSMNQKRRSCFSELTGLINRNEDVSAAAAGLRILPRASWPNAQAGAAAAGLVAWARTIPATDRTGEDYVEGDTTGGRFGRLSSC